MNLSDENNKLIKERYKMNTKIIKNYSELKDMIEDGEIKNLKIHNQGISYEIDYKKRCDNTYKICTGLIIALVFLFGIIFGIMIIISK